ncbi:MAG: 3-deoxy-D-manno-octulosonic acid transferase [Opitutae bacterium]|nr:3-deoxy-D-manno-octulosonic acid transferase [Opitutae bacterium]
MLRRGGYGNKISFRIGNWPILKPKNPEVRRIWIQAVSVGELASLSKLLKILLADPKVEIVLSGTTSTGLKLIEEKYGNQLLAHGPFPLDWLPFVRKAWKQIMPDLVIVVDSELWPEHFHHANAGSIPLLIVNARLSNRSFARLKKISLFRSLLIPKSINILAASERQCSKWIELGAGAENVQKSGNLKIDALDFKSLQSNDSKNLRSQFGFNSNSIVLTGVSTWAGEEKMLIEITQVLRLENYDVRLLLVPRHAERRMEIRKTLDLCQIPYHLRSVTPQAPKGTVVYLADTTGELVRLMQGSDLAFLGKTLPNHQGGQNPIEPIASGIPLVIGPCYQNFRETCSDIFHNQAAIRTDSKSDVIAQILRLVRDPEKRDELKHATSSWMEQQGSPTDFTLKVIRQLIG